jgi:hypothetical protein
MRLLLWLVVGFFLIIINLTASWGINDMPIVSLLFLLLSVFICFIAVRFFVKKDNNRWALYCTAIALLPILFYIELIVKNLHEGHIPFAIVAPAVVILFTTYGAGIYYRQGKSE